MGSQDKNEGSDEDGPIINKDPEAEDGEDTNKGDNEDGSVNKNPGTKDGEDTKNTEVSPLSMTQVAEKFGLVNKLLSSLDNKSSLITDTIQGLRTSLEFSQMEVDTLKNDNEELRKKLEDLDTEGRRSAYHIKKVEDKLDRVETLTKRKNLIFEGVPEDPSGKEDLGKTIWDIFDQLKVNTGMDLEACYLQGNPNKYRTRPIIITFQRQADRDVVYNSRMNLRKTPSYKQVWMNEDLGQISKKTRKHGQNDNQEGYSGRNRLQDRQVCVICEQD